jgi:lipopolysaccharide export system permease protein
LAEVHHRWALGFSCLVFMLVGTPLGIISRWKHPLSAFAFSMLPVLLIYYPLTMGGQALSKEGKLPPVLAMWAGNILLFIIAVVLFYRIGHRRSPEGGILFRWSNALRKRLLPATRAE